MNKLMVYIFLVALLLCSCSGGMQEPKKSQTTSSLTNDSALSDAGETVNKSMSSDLSISSPEATNKPIENSGVVDNKERLIQTLIEARPEDSEVEIREEIDKIYENISRGETVSFGPFTYQDPMDYFKEIFDDDEDIKSIQYTYLLAQYISFELQLSHKTLIAPEMLTAMEKEDPTDAMKVMPEFAAYKFTFFGSGIVKGMEIADNVNSHVLFVCVNENESISVEIVNVSKDSPVLEDVRNIFLSMR